MSGRRNCAECGAAIELQPLPEATRPWRHVDIEDRRVSTCPGASLLAHGALVRVDNDPESDAPWSTFLAVNMDAGLDLESIAEIEEALVTCGEYVGHHDADVALVSHIEARARAEAIKRGRRVGKVETTHAFARAAVDEAEARASMLAWLDLANVARHGGRDGIADYAIAKMMRSGR